MLLQETERLEAKSALEKKHLKVVESTGLNGLLLTSAQWHKENPKACKQYFLFPTFDELKAYLGAFWPSDFGDSVAENERFASSLPGKKLTKFEKCLITMMRLNGSGERLFDLQIIWNRSQKSIRRAIQHWAPRIGEMGNILSILDIPERYLSVSCPHDYKEAKFMNVAALVDGKVIMNGENRKSSVHKRASYSDKVNLNL